MRDALSMISDQIARFAIQWRQRWRHNAAANYWLYESNRVFRIRKKQVRKSISPRSSGVYVFGSIFVVVDVVVVVVVDVVSADVSVVVVDVVAIAVDFGVG